MENVGNDTESGFAQNKDGSFSSPEFDKLAQTIISRSKKTNYYIEKAFCTPEKILALKGEVESEDDDGYFVKITSSDLKRAARDPLGLYRTLATLPKSTRKEQLAALATNPRITIEETDKPAKFMLTFPKTHLDEVTQIVKNFAEYGKSATLTV